MLRSMVRPMVLRSFVRALPLLAIAPACSLFLDGLPAEPPLPGAGEGEGEGEDDARDGEGEGDVAGGGEGEGESDGEGEGEGEALFLTCDGGVVDAAHDIDNCGGCGARCERCEDASCELRVDDEGSLMGRCLCGGEPAAPPAPRCPSPQQVCDETDEPVCVDTRTSSAHCGECHNACSFDAVTCPSPRCVDGACDCGLPSLCGPGEVVCAAEDGSTRCVSAADDACATASD